MFIVITPARNEADQVKELVSCMRASTFQPDCWLVVDDGSTDGTGDLFRKYGADLDYLKIHRIESRSGYCHADGTFSLNATTGHHQRRWHYSPQARQGRPAYVEDRVRHAAKHPHET